jgi:hypothetical protein
MQHFSYKSEKNKLKTRDGSTRREKNTCRERFKGNVGLHTATLQSNRQSDTNRSHKSTRTEIISCDNKILCKEEEYKYTSLVLQRGVCVREMFCPPKKVRKCELAGMRSKNKPPKQNKMRNEEEEGMKEDREKSTEEQEEEEKDTFENFFL